MVRLWPRANGVSQACVGEGSPAEALPGLVRGAREIGESALDPLGDHLDVVHRVVVREEAEVDPAVVGHDRDEQGLVGRQEPDGEDVLELAAQQVDRHLRAGHVRHDQVEEPGREVDPRRLGEQRRRGEVVEARDHLGPERLLRVLQVPHLGADLEQALDRVLDVDGQRRPHRRDLVAQLPVLVLAADRNRHLRAHLEPLGPDAAPVEPFPDAAGDDGQHDVVDGATELVLDPLELRQVAANPDEPPVRADLDVQGNLGSGVGEVPRDLAERPGQLTGLRERRARLLRSRARAGGPVAGAASRRPRPPWRRAGPSSAGTPEPTRARPAPAPAPA